MVRVSLDNATALNGATGAVFRALLFSLVCFCCCSLAAQKSVPRASGMQFEDVSAKARLTVSLAKMMRLRFRGGFRAPDSILANDRCASDDPRGRTDPAALRHLSAGLDGCYCSADDVSFAAGESSGTS